MPHYKNFVLSVLPPARDSLKTSTFPCLVHLCLAIKKRRLFFGLWVNLGSASRWPQCLVMIPCRGMLEQLEGASGAFSPVPFPGMFIQIHPHSSVFPCSFRLSALGTQTSTCISKKFPKKPNLGLSHFFHLYKR